MDPYSKFWESRAQIFRGLGANRLLEIDSIIHHYTTSCISAISQEHKDARAALGWQDKRKHQVLSMANREEFRGVKKEQCFIMMLLNQTVVLEAEWRVLRLICLPHCWLILMPSLISPYNPGNRNLFIMNVERSPLVTEFYFPEELQLNEFPPS